MRQMAIKNSVSNYFLSTFLDSINVFDCHLSGVYMQQMYKADNILSIRFLYLLHQQAAKD